jgi:hypothetical protein
MPVTGVLFVARGEHENFTPAPHTDVETSAQARGLDVGTSRTT